VTAPWSVRSITRTLLPILLVLTLLELVGGFTLGANETALLRYPTLLVLVPVTIGTAGNLGSVLSARLSTALHLGTLSFTLKDDAILGNAIASALLAVTVFPVVGFGAWLVTTVAGSVRLSVSVVIGIALTSGVVLAGLTIGIALGATYVAYRLELDPDDVVIPVVTNVCDVLGVLVLIAVVQVSVG
jgi:mgtE-like transporter